MDNLTHTMLGAAFGRAGLARRTPLGMAALMVGANLSDLDVLGLPFGWNLGFRRGITHGLPALVLWPFVLTGALLAWHHWKSRSGPRAAPIPRQLLLLSTIGILSHPLLDWFNSYGMRWLMPIRDTWWYGDTWFIVDPWVLGVLAFALVASRADRDGHRPRRPAQVGLLAVGIYALAMGLGSALGRRQVRSDLAFLGFPAPGAVMVTPVPVNPLERLVVVDGGHSYLVGSLRVGGALRLDPERPIVTGMSSIDRPAIEADPQGRQFLAWARFPFARVRMEGDTVVTILDDARYSDGGRRSFAYTEVRVPARR